ncbi:GNAT family N-acetyltransferase [Flammeovirga sp. SubArs3]|uniref:GNAT family N-acetyltransferase n=1 Tax=Flammeovirga sp. SubArs3 TaxID=2995316 RepID=UPI00248B25F7|nr:GNAT family N-acetyltransferase [Flammeovirga sp. SubArs3]
MMQTNRVKLSLLTEVDLDELIVLFKEPHVMDFIFPMIDLSDEERKKTLQSKIKEIETDVGYFWTVRDPKTNELMGIVNLNPIPRTPEKMQIGWIFSPRFGGKGLAYEASKLIFDYGANIKKVSPIYAVIEEGNLPSVKLANKLGLTWFDYYMEEDLKVNLYKWEV